MNYVSLETVLTDPAKCKRLGELVEQARQLRSQIEESHGYNDDIGFAVNMDLRIDTKEFEKLVNRVMRESKSGVADLDAVVEAMVQDKERNRKY